MQCKREQPVGCPRCFSGFLLRQVEQAAEIAGKDFIQSLLRQTKIKQPAQLLTRFPHWIIAAEHDMIFAKRGNQCQRLFRRQRIKGARSIPTNRQNAHR